MEYLLIISITLTFTTIYISLKLGLRDAFERVTLAFLFFILFHFSYRLAYDWFDFPRYVDSSFPFGLAYGPFLYFGLKVSRGKQLVIRHDLWHLIPFFFALGITFLIFVSPSFREAYYRLYIVALYSAIPVSFLIYMMYAIFSAKRTRGSFLYRNIYKVFGPSVIILLCLGLYFLVTAFTRIIPRQPSGSLLPVFLIYLAMTVQVLVVLRYRINSLVKQSIATDKELDESALGSVPNIRYQKSLISDEMLDQYEEKLDRLTEKKIFRTPDLSLEMVAREIGGPNHHITQMINIRKGKSFNQYINALRISYACSLLSDTDKWSSIEELAYECGFSSKASFNRNFKNFVQKTPTDYLKGLN